MLSRRQKGQRCSEHIAFWAADVRRAARQRWWRLVGSGRPASSRRLSYVRRPASRALVPPAASARCVSVVTSRTTARALHEEGSHVLVFARLPVIGRVKSRLAAGTSPAAACAFYSECASHTLKEVDAYVGSDASLHFSDAGDADGVRAWTERLGVRCSLVAQRGDALGERLRCAFEWAFEHTRARSVLVVGTDVPDLSASCVRAACKALCEHDVVLGPAYDGGFYLLGLRERVTTSLFEGVPWSSGEVLAAVLERARAAGLNVAPRETLPTLRDIDTLADLLAWRAACGDTHPLRRAADAALVSA